MYAAEERGQDKKYYEGCLVTDQCARQYRADLQAVVSVPRISKQPERHTLMHVEEVACEDSETSRQVKSVIRTDTVTCPVPSLS